MHDIQYTMKNLPLLIMIQIWRKSLYSCDDSKRKFLQSKMKFKCLDWPAAQSF